jgi:hypothetical protein
MSDIKDQARQVNREAMIASTQAPHAAQKPTVGTAENGGGKGETTGKGKGKSSTAQENVASSPF